MWKFISKTSFLFWKIYLILLKVYFKRIIIFKYIHTFRFISVTIYFKRIIIFWKIYSNVSIQFFEEYFHMLWYVYDEHLYDKKLSRLSFSKINYKSIFAITKSLRNLIESLLYFAFVDSAMYVICNFSR